MKSMKLMQSFLVISAFSLGLLMVGCSTTPAAGPAGPAGPPGPQGDSAHDRDHDRDADHRQDQPCGPGEHRDAYRGCVRD
jgi:hypothetical protein